MAKTIRSPPTSHILVLNQFFGLLLYFQDLDPKWTFSFFIFQPPYRYKDRPPKEKDAHGPSLHIRCLYKSHFWYGIYNIFSTCWSKPDFWNYCRIVIVLCISDSNIGDPRFLWFQGTTLISKLEPYPKGISIFDLLQLLLRKFWPSVAERHAVL